MKQIWCAAGLIASASAAIAAWDETQSHGASQLGTAAQPRPVLTATASCDEAHLYNRTDPNWRRKSSGVGSFGLYGPGRNFNSRAVRELPNGNLLTKVPAIVEGRRSVTLRIPRVSRNRVGLDFGDHSTEKRVEDAPTDVIFEPCARKPRTEWGGGLVLTNHRALTLLVEVEGRSGTRSFRIGR